MKQKYITAVVGLGLLAMIAIALVGLPLFSSSTSVSADYRQAACPSGESDALAILGGGAQLFASLESLQAMTDGVAAPAGDRYVICVDEFNENSVGVDAAGLHRFVKRSDVSGVIPRFPG
ncbi:MAG: hypothetical protein D6737_10600 [Chloroflexi bacterium]|nr:MAG: hypothetical protein CUN54_00180 [Phototrophicales bacterium]RMF79683.1 MAG: hypothetical protein D6737_10600 [Chloroflexota bacterium]